MTGREFENAGAVAEAVRRHADTLPAGGAPWAELERRHRRGTLRRAALAAGAAVAAVLLAGAALTTGPFRAAPPQPAAPVEAEPRGRLATDPEFVAGLREAVTREGADLQAVVYGDDVAGRRVALTRQREPGGEVLEWWWIGQPGTPAADLSLATGSGPQRLRTLVLDTGARELTVLAVGPPGGRMAVRTNEDITAAGTPTTPWQDGEETEPGVFTATVPRGVPQARVRVTGAPGGDVTGSAAGVNGELPGAGDISDAAWWAASGGAAFGVMPESMQVQLVYDELGLPSGTPGAKVLWVHRGGAATEVAAVLRAPSGGYAAVVFEVYPPITTGDGGGVAGARLLAAAPRAAGAEDLGMAWYAPGPREPERPLTASALLVAVGPRAAARAVVDAGELGLAGGVGSGELPGAREVRFADAGGRELGAVPVTPLWEPGDVLAAG